MGSPSFLSLAETHRSPCSITGQPSSPAGRVARQPTRTRAIAARITLQGKAPKCYTIVVYGRDIFLGNICCIPRGLWTSKDIYIRLAKEALTLVFHVETRANLARPLDQQVVLESGYTATSEEFVDLVSVQDSPSPRRILIIMYG